MCALVWQAAAITRRRFVISVKVGLTTGLGAQHCSISFFHSESQEFGIAGLSVLFTIPPENGRKQAKPKSKLGDQRRLQVVQVIQLIELLDLHSQR